MCYIPMKHYKLPKPILYILWYRSVLYCVGIVTISDRWQVWSIRQEVLRKHFQNLKDFEIFLRFFHMVAGGGGG